MEDIADSKSVAARRVGSNPTTRTINNWACGAMVAQGTHNLWVLSSTLGKPTIIFPVGVIGNTRDFGSLILRSSRRREAILKIPIYKIKIFGYNIIKES